MSGAAISRSSSRDFKGIWVYLSTGGTFIGPIEEVSGWRYPIIDADSLGTQSIKGKNF